MELRVIPLTVRGDPPTRSLRHVTHHRLLRRRRRLHQGESTGPSPRLTIAMRRPLTWASPYRLAAIISIVCRSRCRPTASRQSSLELLRDRPQPRESRLIDSRKSASPFSSRSRTGAGRRVVGRTARLLGRRRSVPLPIGVDEQPETAPSPYRGRESCLPAPRVSSRGTKHQAASASSRRGSTGRAGPSR